LFSAYTEALNEYYNSYEKTWYCWENIPNKVSNTNIIKTI
jgi:hypothetical protein